MRLRGSESGRQVVACSGLHLTGLVNPFDLTIRFGERVAIVGPNGTGKSHFVRLLSGEPVAHEGTVTLGARIKVGAFNQMHEHPEWIGKTVIEILAAADLTYARSMATLARYELQQCENQTFETLSGGQQARLQVLLLELGGANLLLLDEPTDNLDLDSAEALERALDEFTGTVIAVTHDRWFMRSLDRFLYFDRNGDVSEAPDLETVLPVLGGEAAATSGTRRLKPLSLNPTKPAVVSAIPARPGTSSTTPGRPRSPPSSAPLVRPRRPRSGPRQPRSAPIGRILSKRHSVNGG